MGPLIDAFLTQRFAPAWTDPTDQQVEQLRERVCDAAIALVRDISPREAHLRTLSPNVAETLATSNSETSDWNLAILRALRQIIEEVGHLADEYASEAGMAGANYPDLGKAWGVSRQAARKRWPGVVSSLNPDAYRGREPVHFRAYGGEAQVSFHPQEGGWWWIATAANGQNAEAPEDVTYDTSEEASATAGAFLATNAVQTTA
ncbi:hypothetical protein KN815_16215 [Streptomyces sp. 4503]|uniref:Uncharacterized protein n=2 Tax=Streptomyces niphimycinicus TaxID=2842201 RepID=A0ABS6CF59_9ACTN|nr:hypothetical protein [Streptomyces niphimycinicus]